MRSDVTKLIGETLKFIDDGGDSILLTTESGRQFQIYHSQDCCESVNVLDTKGVWHSLVGKVIVHASHEEESPDEEIGSYDSATLTTLTFKTDEHTVISRWIGESNGYYSESVDVEEISNSFKG